MDTKRAGKHSAGTNKHLGLVKDKHAWNAVLHWLLSISPWRTFLLPPTAAARAMGVSPSAVWHSSSTAGVRSSALQASTSLCGNRRQGHAPSWAPCCILKVTSCCCNNSAHLHDGQEERSFLFAQSPAQLLLVSQLSGAANFLGRGMEPGALPRA